MSKNILKSSAPLRVGTAGSNPASADNGTIYYNTSDNVYRIYENGQWKNLATEAYVNGIELDNLFDVAIAGEVSGDVLLFNGTNWVNSTDLSTATSDIDALQLDVGSLQTDVSGALSDISSLQTDVSGALSDIGSLQTDVSGALSDISTLQTDVSGALSDIGSLQTDVSGALSDIGSLQTDVSGALSDIGSLQTDVSGALSDIGSLQTDVSGALSDIGSLQTDVSGALSDIVTLQSDVSSLQNLGLDGLSDVTLVTEASDDILQYDGSAWVNVAPLAQRTDESDAGKIIVSDGSGFLHESFLQFDIDFGGHILSGVDEIQGAATLELRPVDGVSIIASSASSANVLSVYGAVSYFDKDHNTEFVSEKVVAETLSASTTAALAPLGFDSSTVKGAVIEYRMYDTSSNECRVGVIKVAVTADGDDASLADSYVETADLGVSWEATVSSGAVSLSYTTGSGAKNFKAKVKFI